MSIRAKKALKQMLYIAEGVGHGMSMSLKLSLFVMMFVVVILSHLLHTHSHTHIRKKIEIFFIHSHLFGLCVFFCPIMAPATATITKAHPRAHRHFIIIVQTLFHIQIFSFVRSHKNDFLTGHEFNVILFFNF